MLTWPSRRQFLGLCGAVAAGMLPLGATAQTPAARLKVTDAVAQSLGYIENASQLKPAQEATYKAGAICGNCKLYVTAQEKAGYAPCGAVGGKLVARAGWCRAHVA